MNRYQSSPLALSTQVDAVTLAALKKKYRAGPFTRYFIRPFLMALLVLALMTGIVYIIQGITLDGRWTADLILFFLVALEAIYTTIWLKHPDRLPLNRTVYRAAEFFLILIIVRIASWIIFAEGIPTTSELLAYLSSPGSLFFNITFLVTSLLTLITWRLAILLSSTFSSLEISEFEFSFYSLPARIRKARADDQPIQLGRSQLVQEFQTYWLWGGTLLAVSAGLSTIELQTIRNMFTPLEISRLGMPPLLLGMLLIYFAAGFWLLSQARLMEQNVRWMTNDVITDSGLEQTWQRFSLLIILLIGLGAAFLPIGSTLAISRILGAVIYWGVIIVNFLIVIIMLPILALMALFSGQSEELEPRPLFPDNPIVPQNLPETINPLNDTISMVLSSAFWAIFLVILVLSFLYYLRERKINTQGRSSSQLLATISAWLHIFWQRLFSIISSISLQLSRQQDRASKIKAEEPGRKFPWRFIRVGALSPREQIRYYYLSIVRRAGDSGVKRNPSETPIEYAEDLRENWPEIEDGVEELTEAFLRARYSSRPVTAADVPDVKSNWKKVRRELRQSSKENDDEDNSLDEERNREHTGS